MEQLHPKKEMKRLGKSTIMCTTVGKEELLTENTIKNSCLHWNL
jgi:hypothetical protein